MRRSSSLLAQASRPLANGAAFLAVALSLGLTACSAAAGGASTSQAAAGHPAGTVTVKAGNKVVCVITLKGSTGTCKVNTAAYPPGTLKFTGTYSGGAGFRSSAGSANLRLLRATSKTVLALSAAKVVYGHEQAERLSVRVVPQFSGTPAGKVTVKSGSAVVCVITLAHGAGSCVLTATKLAPGSHPLVAGYSGSASFAPSASVKQTLTVTR
jgi:hypothetical protein